MFLLLVFLVMLHRSKGGKLFTSEDSLHSNAQVVKADVPTVSVTYFQYYPGFVHWAYVDYCSQAIMTPNDSWYCPTSVWMCKPYCWHTHLTKPNKVMICQWRVHGFVLNIFQFCLCIFLMNYCDSTFFSRKKKKTKIAFNYFLFI